MTLLPNLRNIAAIKETIRSVCAPESLLESCCSAVSDSRNVVETAPVQCESGERRIRPVVRVLTVYFAFFKDSALTRFARSLSLVFARPRRQFILPNCSWKDC